MTPANSPDALLRINQVLTRFPISRASWYAGIQAGKYPQPLKLGARAVAWKASDVEALIQSLSK